MNGNQIFLRLKTIQHFISHPVINIIIFYHETGSDVLAAITHCCSCNNIICPTQYCLFNGSGVPYKYIIVMAFQQPRNVYFSWLFHSFNWNWCIVPTYFLLYIVFYPSDAYIYITGRKRLRMKMYTIDFFHNDYFINRNHFFYW